MSARCPAGHLSTAEDYCDVCGMPIDGSATPESDQADGGAPSGSSASAPAAAADGAAPAGCPNCGAPHGPDALFCESCGYDFTTGSMPRPPSPAGAPPATAAGADSTAAPSGAAASTGWVAEVWVDPAWYAGQQSPDRMPSPGPPAILPLRGRSLLVGRVSHSRNINPDLDCGTDSGVSRRQAQLTTDGTRWWVEDLESANGTFVGPAAGDLPEQPIPVGTKVELAPDDRVYVGAWTRIVIRQATEDEQAG